MIAVKMAFPLFGLLICCLLVTGHFAHAHPPSLPNGCERTCITSILGFNETKFAVGQGVDCEDAEAQAEEEFQRRWPNHTNCGSLIHGTTPVCISENAGGRATAYVYCLPDSPAPRSRAPQGRPPFGIIRRR